ncbi:uncharacterized protein LOC112568623 isoform X2 [Pomacea canaliculata]|uniref:uncharacterized protein LOC112568623 isoform X2 n=1 Tax=Pomacea canaliculata TaxID=400727 RepID=UPI000D72844D|nr:uncharacterized protein LOC112568623 isoform X2 [Pomacea canaliculata]
MCTAAVVTAWEIGEELKCPEVFTDGINNIACRINQTAIGNAVCLSMQKSVTFDLTVDSSTTTACLAAYNSLDNCTGKQNEEQCWCDHKDGNIFVYKFSFHFNRTIHKGGQMECKLCIPPPSSNHLATTVTGSCKHFKAKDLGSATERPVNSRAGLTVAEIFILFYVAAVFVLGPC